MSKDFADAPPNPLSIPVGFLIELSETNDQHDVLSAFARWVKLILDCGRISVLLPSKDPELLVSVLVEDNQIVETDDFTKLEGTTLGMLYRQGRSGAYPDLTKVDTPDADSVVKVGLKAGIVAPITFGGRCLGLLVATYFEKKETLDEDLLVLESMGRCLASYMILHEQLEELSQLALTDSLTKAHNRRSFQQFSTEVFDHWLKTEEPFALMICDLDHFKRLNDTYGHDFGDIVLCKVADAMREVARGSDYVVRMGGEEFCLFMPSADLDIATGLAEDVRRHIENLHLTCDGERVHITTSVGVSVIGAHHDSVRALTIAADQALYEAKQSGRNKVIQVL